MEEKLPQEEKNSNNDNLTSNSQEAKKKTSKDNSGSFRNKIKDKAHSLGVDPSSLLANRLRSLRNHQNQVNNNGGFNPLVNALQKRRAQLPNRRNTSEKQQDSNEKTTSTTEGSATGAKENTKKHSLFKKPHILGNDENEESVEGNEGTNFLSSLFGRKKKDPVTSTVRGMAKLTGAAMTPIIAALLPLIFLFLIIIMVPTMIVSAFAPIFSVSEKLDLDTGDEVYESDDKEEMEFSERLAKVQEEYDEEHKEISAQVISGVYAVVNAYNDEYTYEDMTKHDMETVADMMIDTKKEADGTETYTYDVEKFKKELASDFLPKKVKGQSDEMYAQMAEEVLQYVEDYKSLIGAEETSSTTASSANQCSYDLTSVNYEEGKTIKAGIQPSDIKVRLMQAKSCGGTTGQALEGEALVDFEKYILGVAYAEIGDIQEEQAFKAMLVVARSFALVNAVAKQRNNLYQEDGQWIMEITNCNADQYYCDPDQGCSWDGTSGNRHLLSGTTTGPDLYKPVLAADAPQRTWAADVMGKVALDADKKVFWTNFADSTQKEMRSLANQGLDYTSILLNIYGDKGLSTIGGGSCRNVTSGTYTSWKQNDPAWANVVLGGGTDQSRSLGKIGCLVTSIAALIQKSGVAPTPFDPGIFATKLNSVNGFNSRGELSYAAVTRAVPSFVYVRQEALSGRSQSDKLRLIKEYVDNGYYCTVQVLPEDSGGTHWVAIDYIDGNNIKMIDPGQVDNGTDLWDGYDWQDTSRMQCFKTQ